MKKILSSEENSIRERVSFLFQRDRIQERRKMSEIASFCGVANSAVIKWKDKTSTPEAINILSLSKYFKVHPNWILTGELVENGLQKNGNIAGVIRDKSLQQVESWMLSTNDGLEYGPIVKGLVAKEYPDFRDWLKKNNESEQRGTGSDMG